MTRDIVDDLREQEMLTGLTDEAQLCKDAADEIVRLRGELENIQRDRMAQVEVENLRQDVQFWTDEARKFKESSRHNYAECARLHGLIKEWADAMSDKADSFGGLVRYEAARDALREEANR